MHFNMEKFSQHIVFSKIFRPEREDMWYFSPTQLNSAQRISARANAVQLISIYFEYQLIEISALYFFAMLFGKWIQFDD